MPAPTVTVLSYHRIALPSNPDLADSLIDAYPSDFEDQMRYLAAHYNVVSSWDLLRALQEGSARPSRAVVITFDDGYLCFKEAAMPVLRRLGLPVTLFVATHLVGTPGGLFWWGELHRALNRTALPEIDVQGLGTLPLRTAAEKQLAFGRLVPFLERLQQDTADALLHRTVQSCGVPPNQEKYLLDWEDLRELEAEGVAIGPHTRHHPILAQTSPERITSETAGSWFDLRAKLQRPLPLFCYPNGQAHAVNAAAVRAVRAAGLAGAFTTVPGLNVIGRTDPYLMWRIGSSAGESLRHFAIKLTPAGRVYRKLKGLALKRG